MNIKVGQRWQGRISDDVILNVTKIVAKTDTVLATVDSGEELSYYLSTFEEYYQAMAPRSIREIAREIRRTWNPVWFGAVPYLEAMSTLDSIHEEYYADSAESVVLYFLANASTWKGPVAKRIKAELKYLLSLVK